jgi:hypothetical protein
MAPVQEMKPCIKCGSTERYDGGSCKDCQARLAHAWYLKHTELMKRRAKDWEALHPKEISLRKRKWRTKHKEQIQTKARETRMQRPRYNRTAQIKSRYGITRARYDELLIEQSGRCAICGKPFKDTRTDPAIDHDHTDGRIRGLLHHQCNSAIGLLQDNPDICQTAADYLRKK